MRRVTLVVLASLIAFPAVAQTAMTELIISQGGLCFEVDGTGPVPDGTRVKLAPCRGRRTQRWRQLYGDYNYMSWAVSGQRLGIGPPDSHGVRRVEIGDRVEELHHVRGTLQTDSGVCVTRRGRELLGEPCRPRDPLQRW